MKKIPGEKKCHYHFHKLIFCPLKMFYCRGQMFVVLLLREKKSLEIEIKRKIILLKNKRFNKFFLQKKKKNCCFSGNFSNSVSTFFSPPEKVFHVKCVLHTKCFLQPKLRSQTVKKYFPQRKKKFKGFFCFSLIQTWRFSLVSLTKFYSHETKKLLEQNIFTHFKC